MARNIEIKAVVSDAAALRERVAARATDGPYYIEQHDTFFDCAQARLKLRRFADGSGELIGYRRADAAGPTACAYERSATADPRSLARLLEHTLGRRGEVRKTRTLYYAGRTRIHLDAVEGLGDFVELEVVLAAGEAEARGRAEAEALMAALAIAPERLCTSAYIDLLEARQGR